MKRICYRHGAIDNELAELIEANGITMTCDENMNFEISEHDYEKLMEIAPAAADDFCEAE